MKLLVLFLFISACSNISSGTLSNEEREQVVREVFLKEIIGTYKPLNKEIAINTVAGVKKISFSADHGMIVIQYDESYPDTPISIEIFSGNISSTEITSISRGDATQSTSLIIYNSVQAVGNHFLLKINNSATQQTILSDRFSIAIKNNQFLINGIPVAYKSS
ncbi:MAG: hypothetical protein ACRCTJ_05760 [Brevinema sp.]